MAARAATTVRASGSRAHAAMMSSTASGSLSTRLAPSRRARRSPASAAVSRFSVSGYAPSVATRPVRWLRLVTMARHPDEPGSSGRTCSTSRALSSTTSTRLPLSRLRYRAAWAGRPAGIRATGIPNASRNPRTASSGSSACPSGSKPPRLTYNCPSGNCAATRCAQCRARAVLPTPAVPDTAEMITWAGPVEPVLATGCRIASRLASSALRPAKAGTAGASCAGIGAAGKAGDTVTADVGASRAGSCRRMLVSRSRSGWLGSIPSSSSSVLRNRWYTPSASACRPLRYSATMSWAWTCSSSG